MRPSPIISMAYSSSSFALATSWPRLSRDPCRLGQAGVESRPEERERGDIGESEQRVYSGWLEARPRTSWPPRRPWKGSATRGALVQQARPGGTQARAGEIVVQAAVGPATAQIGADIKPGLTIRRQNVGRRRNVHIRCARCARGHERRQRTAAEQTQHAHAAGLRRCRCR
jgi:hypothetical protein